MTLILRDVELAGRRTDVAVSGDGRVSATGRLRPGPRDTLVEGRGGALLPGLADRHVHLLALAKSLESVDCGPPRIRTAEALADALRARATATAPDAWIRGWATTNRLRARWTGTDWTRWFGGRRSVSSTGAGHCGR